MSATGHWFSRSAGQAQRRLTVTTVSATEPLTALPSLAVAASWADGWCVDTSRLADSIPDVLACELSELEDDLTSTLLSRNRHLTLAYKGGMVIRSEVAICSILRHR